MPAIAEFSFLTIVKVIGSALALTVFAGCTSNDVPGFGSSTVPQQVKAEPQPPSIGAFLSGPAGNTMDNADRSRAAKAQIDAVSSGKRTQWRAERSDAYGYVEVGAASGSTNECRSYQHTLYRAGRSQKGSGQACKSADGNWEIVS